MFEEPREQVTRILRDLGRPDSSHELFPLVYDELRALARGRMEAERSGHTLEATALVHEAYLRLVTDENLAWPNRRQFFAAAAEAMRRILIDHARRKRSKKRGAGAARVALEVAELGDLDDTDRLLEVDEALGKFAAEDERAGLVVRLRFYGGLSVEEIARALELSPRTVLREWNYAKVRLYQLLEPDGPEST